MAGLEQEESYQSRGLPRAPQALARLASPLAQPDFRAQLGGIVNIRSLTQLYKCE
jgi:hypothetical protein